MRFHMTPAFSGALSSWKAAYADHDRIASRATGRLADCTPESKVASDREYAALDALMLMPAATPGEVAEKFRIMTNRDFALCEDGIPSKFAAQLERDLINLQRPAVSGPIAEAFAAWAEAHARFHTTPHPDDATGDALCNESSAAFCALMKMPSYAPGDLIAKLYANMLGEHGSTLRVDPDPSAFVFELDKTDLPAISGTCDSAAAVAFARDVADCDLGRCMIALGRVDFDAAAWLAAADRAGVTVQIVDEADNTSRLWIGEVDGETSAQDNERRFIVQALLAGGLGPVGAERRHDVEAAIRSERPHLVAKVPAEVVA